MSGKSLRTERACVYFAQAGDGGPVKIGFSRSGPGRIKDLQIACPWDLRLIGVMAADGMDAERRLHQRFASARIRGEWFEPTPELLAFVADHAPTPDSAEWRPHKLPPATAKLPPIKRPRKPLRRRIRKPSTPEGWAEIRNYLSSTKRK